MVGGNFRMDAMQAAVLRVKLRHLERFNEARRAVARRYRDKLAGANSFGMAAQAIADAHHETTQVPVWDVSQVLACLRDPEFDYDTPYVAFRDQPPAVADAPARAELTRAAWVDRSASRILVERRKWSSIIGSPGRRAGGLRVGRGATRVDGHGQAEVEVLLVVHQPEALVPTQNGGVTPEKAWTASKGRGGTSTSGSAKRSWLSPGTSPSAASSSMRAASRTRSRRTSGAPLRIDY